MNRELQEFANTITREWDTVPKDKVIEEIKGSIKKSRTSLPETLEGIRNDFGIYAFYIKPEKPYSAVEDLIDVWNEDGFKKYPKVVKRRFNEQTCCSEGWYCMYIGKGENLRNRIEEHLTHPAKHATYGLKLKERLMFLKQNKIQIGFWHLPEMENVPKEIKQFIITNFESELRKKLKPWIGKQ